MNEELKKATTVSEMFKILEKYYDLQNCKPGMTTKAVIINNLGKFILLTGAKKKM
jgi:hypothetical protein